MIHVDLMGGAIVQSEVSKIAAEVCNIDHRLFDLSDG